jgi:peptidoglycan/LPS O-acetylase OafA/YrhL
MDLEKVNLEAEHILPEHQCKPVKRDDIQGLRAFAIITVLFFHIQPKLLPYGYFGVDM